MSRPVRQMLRSWRLRSFALMSCNSFMSVRSDVHPPNTIETYAGVFRTLQSLLRNFHQNCIRYVVSWLRLTSVNMVLRNGRVLVVIADVVEVAILAVYIPCPHSQPCGPRQGVAVRIALGRFCYLMRRQLPNGGRRLFFLGIHDRTDDRVRHRE